MFWLKRTTGLLVSRRFSQLPPRRVPANSPRNHNPLQPHPTPEKDQETVKVFTEEVRLPVVALDAYGHYDPTLELDDILVLEDGVAQQLRSVRHVPANVLFLLDTGGESSGLGRHVEKHRSDAPGGIAVSGETSERRIDRSDAIG
jgi:hypothetical protein